VYEQPGLFTRAPDRPGAPRFIGLQTRTGAVAFRRLRLRAL
jgi:hypothetical protein